MMKPHITSLFVLLALAISTPFALSSAPVQASPTTHEIRTLPQIEAFNFDFDDNIFTTDARIMAWDPGAQKEIGISTAEWALAKEKVGKEEPWKHLTLRPQSLRYFTDETDLGIFLFAEQILKALKKPGNAWKAPSWSAFIEALSKPETRAYTTIITARLHSPDSILSGLQVLKDRGYLPALPPKENIFSVGWPGLPEQFKGNNPSESKAKVMTYLLDQLEARPVPHNADWVQDQAGTGKAQLHLWGFSDDDYSNYSKALSVLSQQVALGRWPHVKIVLFFTGLNNPEQKPRSVVIRPDGSTRPTMPNEAVRMRAGLY